MFNLTKSKTYFLFYSNMMLTGVLLLFSCNCSEDDNPPECISTDITINLEMTKSSESCMDLEFGFEITSGVILAFDSDVYCANECTDRYVYYQIRRTVKNNGVVKEDENNNGIFLTCNTVNQVAWSFFDEVGSSSPLYELGDTITYYYHSPTLCVGPESSFDCSGNVELDVPDFTFEYVMAEEDFQCN